MAQQYVLDLGELYIAGIMCGETCVNNIEDVLEEEILARIKKELGLFTKIKPRWKLKPELYAIGSYRYHFAIEYTADVEISLDEAKKSKILEIIEAEISKTFDYLQASKTSTVVKNKLSTQKHWINLFINTLAAVTMTLLFFYAPHALYMTALFSGLGLSATAFTGRDYLRSFINKASRFEFLNMPTVITLGWLLAIAHAAYHIVLMPVMHSYAMIFMNFVMPLCLFFILNVMDLIKTSVANRSQQLSIKSINDIFPISDEYQCDTELVSLHDIHVGKIITVKPGECFPTDGELLEEALLDTSVYDGKLYARIQAHQLIKGGAINRNKEVVHYKTTSTHYHSEIYKIIMRANRRVKQSEIAAEKPSYRHFGIVYGTVYLLAFAAALIVPAALGVLTASIAMSNLLGILFAICPCTIVIAHELPGLLRRSGRTSNGILLRDNNLPDKLAKPDTIVFDKTGTLTTGECLASTELDKDLLAKVVALEKTIGSHHPIGQAIMRLGKNKEQPTVTDEHYDEHHRGISGNVGESKIMVGNAALFADKGIEIPAENAAQVSKNKHLTPIYVAENNICKGVIFIEHVLREDIVEDLKRLKKQNINIVLLTGDNIETARQFNEHIGNVFNPKNVQAGKTPKEKEEYIKSTEGKTWFVCDGPNDAPCARAVTEKGGVSWAISPKTRVSFFCDGTLNGSLRYLFNYKQQNQCRSNITQQNQLLLMLSGFYILSFILLAGISSFTLPTMAPMLIMLMTTGSTLANSYRMHFISDQFLGKQQSLAAQFLASDYSFFAGVTATGLFVTSTLLQSGIKGKFAFPDIVNAANYASAFANSFLILALALTAICICSLIYYGLNEHEISTPPNETKPLQKLDINTAERPKLPSLFNLFCFSNGSDKAPPPGHLLHRPEVRR